MQDRRGLVGIVAVLAILLVIGTVVSISLGAASIDLVEVWQGVFNPDRTLTNHVVIQDVRLPRIFAGILVGACFAVSGAMMQGITRNPLADSGILGINGGATLAVALGFAFNRGIPFNQLLVLAFIGSALSALLVFGVSSMSKGGSLPFRLTITGAVVSALLLAMSQGIGLYFNLSQDLAFWSAGSLAGNTWERLVIAAPIVAVMLLGAFFMSPYVTILNLGDEVATSLGQRVAWIRFICVVIILTLAGIAVALAGNVAYIGLIIPHSVKALVGAKYERIIPISALMGGVFVLFADVLARLINAPEETPIGALIAVVGVPFFIYLIKTKGGNE